MTYYFEQEYEDHCEERERMTLEKVIFENGSYRYSQHYMHLQSISNNQSQPAVNGSFNRRKDVKSGKPKLSFTFYSSQVLEFRISLSGKINMQGEDFFGYIGPFTLNNTDNSDPEFDILDEENETVFSIITPETWINSGTLLEYEAVRRML
ncbi:unnamed protein product [Schistosoma curassoni]|uniref:TLDc domain-containing protein n=1 Tax=Schistosoma curassoni TaxID=6186 RepID=A0A183L0N4_9TREM|nr:unnamed protein product [Schistosoma curassoni]